MPNILVIDDEHSIRESFSLILEGLYNVTLAASGEAGLKAVSSQKQDLVFLDCRMPGMNGLETLKRIKEIDSKPEVIMVTAVNDMQSAGEAIRLGARDYIVKPFDVDQLLHLTEQTLRRKSLANVKVNTQVAAKLIGNSETIKKLAQEITTITAKQKVLILGEAGTEKELVARVIHEQGKRAAKPFVAISLSPSISNAKLKQLFFGFEKGSTTADLNAQSSLFEEASGGTIFINNADLLTPEIVKAIELSEFSRVGSQARKTIDCQIIFGAAAKELKAEVKLKLLPLRERPSDIAALASYFIEKHNHCHARKLEFDPAVLNAFASYSWPGNFEQLSAVIEQLVLNNQEGKVSLGSIPINILQVYKANAGQNLLANFEREYIQAVLEQSGQDKEKAASALEINYNLLSTKI